MVVGIGEPWRRTSTCVESGGSMSVVPSTQGPIQSWRACDGAMFSASCSFFGNLFRSQYLRAHGFGDAHRDVLAGP